MLYLVSYDLKGDGNHDAIDKELTKMEGIRVLRSQWIVGSTMTEEELGNLLLLKVLDKKKDSLLVNSLDVSTAFIHLPNFSDEDIKKLQDPNYDPEDSIAAKILRRLNCLDK